eukprot:366393-Chlamydomonas_euryale.AAC.4
MRLWEGLDSNLARQGASSRQVVKSQPAGHTRYAPSGDERDPSHLSAQAHSRWTCGASLFFPNWPTGVCRVLHPPCTPLAGMLADSMVERASCTDSMH